MRISRHQWRFAPAVTALVISLASTGAGSATSSSAAAPTSGADEQALVGNYGVERLNPLGGTSAFGASVNNRGWVAGTSSVGDGQTHAVVWRDGRTVDLGSLGGDQASSGVLWPVKSERGVVVGISYTDVVDPNREKWSCSAFIPARAGYACRGFVWRDGVMTVLPTLGGTHGFAAGTNNRGDVVGWAENQVVDPTCTGTQRLQFRGVLWSGGEYRPHELAPLPGDTTSSATAINQSGTVVGISGSCGTAVGGISARHAVAWRDGEPRRLQDLGGLAWNTPMALNQRGEIVGFLNKDAGAGTGFAVVPAYWDATGRVQALPLPEGYVYGQALGINNRGVVVGVAYTSNFACTAVVWRNQQVETMTAPELELCAANDINARGQITGQAIDPGSGDSVGFLATPHRVERR